MEDIILHDKLKVAAKRLHAGWIGKEIVLEHPQNDLLLIGNLHEVSFAPGSKRDDMGNPYDVLNVKIVVGGQEVLVDGEHYVGLRDSGSAPALPE